MRGNERHRPFPGHRAFPLKMPVIRSSSTNSSIVRRSSRPNSRLPKLPTPPRERLQPEPLPPRSLFSLVLSEAGSEDVPELSSLASPPPLIAAIDRTTVILNCKPAAPHRGGRFTEIGNVHYKVPWQSLKSCWAC